MAGNICCYLLFVAHLAAASLPRLRIKDYEFSVTQPSNPMYYAMTVVVDNLASNVDTLMLTKLCSQCGLVLECQIAKRRVSNKITRVGEVLFSSPESAYDFVNQSYHSYRSLLTAHLKQSVQPADRGGHGGVAQSGNGKYMERDGYVHQQRSSAQRSETRDAYMSRSPDSSSSQHNQRRDKSKSGGKPHRRQSRGKPRSVDKAVMMQNQQSSGMFQAANPSYLMQNQQSSGMFQAVNSPYLMRNQQSLTAPLSNTPYVMQSQQPSTMPQVVNSPYLMQNQQSPGMFQAVNSPYVMQNQQPSTMPQAANPSYVMQSQQPSTAPPANPPYAMQSQSTNPGTHLLQQPLCCGTLQQMGGVLQSSDNALLVQNFHTQFRPDLVLGLFRTFGTLSLICFVDEQRT